MRQHETIQSCSGISAFNQTCWLNPSWQPASCTEDLQGQCASSAKISVTTVILSRLPLLKTEEGWNYESCSWDKISVVKLCGMSGVMDHQLRSVVVRMWWWHVASQGLFFVRLEMGGCLGRGGRAERSLCDNNGVVGVTWLCLSNDGGPGNVCYILCGMQRLDA